MKNKLEYYIRILFLGFGLIPFAASIIAIFASGIPRSFLFPVFGLFYILAALFAVKVVASKDYPDDFVTRYLPASLPLILTMVTWAVCMVISNGFYGHSIFGVMWVLEGAFFPVLIASSFMGKMSFIFYLPLIYDLSFFIFFILFERKSEKKPLLVKNYAFGFAAVLVISTVIGIGVTLERGKTMLPKDYGFQYGGGYASVDLWNYDRTNPDNKLAKLSNTVTFSISDPNKMPVLDGAEAAYPVYSAFANACYDIKVDNQDQIKYEKYGGNKVEFTNTIYAYERLIKGEVDIFFGAEPSKAQREMAEKAGKKLVLTPIGKEAFVFFVNKENPIDNLSTETIKDIYSGKVKNWSGINGKQEKITAFQRPENSGSQTIMQKIMGDTTLMAPLKEEYVSGMGGVSENVANYRNYPGALGYSFRFFTMGMAENADEIKLLSINDIAPNTENIRNSTYPYTVSLYAITLEENPLETIVPFLNWMQGPQGQELIEKIGYVSL